MKYEKYNPMLSVIIPVYNVESYLDRCINSVLKQSYHQMEIILVDDGSTDRSGAICDIYAEKDPRVKVIHKKNGGLVSARKEGLKNACGVYASYVDADDWIESNMYMDMICLLETSNADVITSGFIRDYGTYCTIQREKIEPGVYEQEALSNLFLARMVSDKSFFCPNVCFSLCTKIFRKELLIQFQETVSDFVNVGEDVAVLYPFFLNAKKIIVSGENYYHYCVRDDSILGKKKEDEWLRYQVFISELESKCAPHSGRVPNIMKQIHLHKYYLMLLQHADRVIWYRNGVLFPFGELNQKERIVLYGAGKFGMELKMLLEEKYGFCITAWIDQTGKSGTQTIACLNRIKYDKIIIAVLVADLIWDIKQILTNLNIEERKILFINQNLLEG